MEEVVDIYNTKKKVIGSDSRYNAHKKGLWHKSVHCYLINSKGQLLMQKRSVNKEFFAGFWDGSFAGHVPTGESSLSAAIREAQEEVGLNLNEEDFEFVLCIKEQLTEKDFINNEFVDIFCIFKDINFDTLKCQKKEVDQLKFVSIEEFENMVKNKEKELFPHYGEYPSVIKYIKNGILKRGKYYGN